MEDWGARIIITVVVIMVWVVGCEVSFIKGEIRDLKIRVETPN